MNIPTTSNIASDTPDNTTRVNKNSLQRMSSRIELNNTLILSIATLAITWCSYQSNLWSGIQTFKLNDVNKYTRMAEEKNLMTLQKQAMDESIVLNFIKEVLQKREDNLEFYLQRVRPELATVLRRWMEANPPYQTYSESDVTFRREYQSLFEKDRQVVKGYLRNADEAWQAAQRANKYADRYGLFNVIFSMAMFLAAITTKMSRIRLSFTLIAIAGLLCIVILFILFLYMPVARS